MEPIEMDVTVSGKTFRMEFDVSKPVHRTIYHDITLCSVPYESDVVGILTEMLQPGDTFVDVGAHIGWFTLLGAKIVGPFGRVLSVEPNIANYRRLKKHLNINGLNGSVRTHRAALYSKAKKAKLYLNADNDGGHALWPTWNVPFNVKSAKKRKVVEVKAVTLDDLCKSENISKIKLVKIDTEGCEGEILKGASGLLSNKQIQHIVMEVNIFGLSQMNTSKEEIIEFMDDYGYDYTRISYYEDEYIYNVLFSLRVD